MSGQREIWAEGYPGYSADFQRTADAAANADDVVWGRLTPPARVYGDYYSGGSMAAGRYDRNVQPLYAELGASGTNPQHHLLVVPDASGTLKVRAARYQVGPVLGAYGLPSLVAFAGDILSPQVTANPGVSIRPDLLYATIQRATTVQGPRPFRNNSGTSTQTLDLATDPTVSLSILPGTPGSGTGPALPADGASSYNIPLALILVPASYSLGDVLAANKIRPVWTRGGVPQHLITPIIGGDGTTTETLIASRIGALQKAQCPVAHSGSPQTKLLIDWNSLDMRQRWVRVVGARPKLDTTYKTPEAITKGGSDNVAGGHAGAFDTGWCHTGTDGDSTHPFYSTTLTNAGNGGAGNIDVSFWADTTDGGLYIKFSGTPYNGTDYWWIVVEFSGSFKLLMNP